jgi:uncharacterized phiE125 gp8 family phage protein
MVLIEETSVAQEALPLQAFKEHLRLGTGLFDDGLQDALLIGYLRAAMAAIEARIGKVLLGRRFRWEIGDWRDGAAQALPVAPVGQVVSVVLVDAAGGRLTADAAGYRLVADMHRPKLAARGTALPTVPTGGQVEIVFEAGFGTVWEAVPADLRQAVLLLAAEFHEKRHEMGLREAALPFGVMALVERWRTVRVLGGGGA